MKLFARYNRIILQATVTIFFISSLLYFFLMNYILTLEVDEVLHHRKARMERYVSQHGRLPAPDRMGEVRVDYTIVQQPIDGIQLSYVNLFDSIEMKSGPFRRFAFTIPVDGQVYHVTLVRPLAGTRNLSMTIILITIGTILLILIISILINRILLRKLWEPFYATIAAMRSYKLGRVKELKLPPTNIDEFVFLGSNLGETIQRAEQDYLGLKEFTENASHELQTPLALIRSKLDLLIQKEDLSEIQSEELKEIYSSVRRLSRLSGSLLLLTKIENKQFEQIAAVDLRKKIEHKVQQFQELWKSNELNLHWRLQDTIVRANDDLTDILLTNLLSNANRHNYKGGDIDIELVTGKLTVSNTGSSKPLDVKRLFRRFYKETSNSQSNGLGLSIIKQICEDSHIRIAYFYNDGKHVFQLDLQDIITL